MKQRRIGLLLTLTLLLALGTIVQDFRFDQAFANDHDVAVKIDREVGALDVQLSDLRAAQTGYLAAGQNPDFWIQRTTDLSKRLRESIDQLAPCRSVSWFDNPLLDQNRRTIDG